MIKKRVAYLGNFPLSKAILHDNKYPLELSGLIGIDPDTGKLAEGIENQTTKIPDSLKETLNEVGWSLDNIIKTRVYLAEMKDYEKMNKIYKKYFTKDYPTRIALAVKELPANASVEMECTASGDMVS